MCWIVRHNNDGRKERNKKMSTRGSLGFRLNGKDFITYNHSDSYPSGLGVEMAEFVVANRANLDSVKEKVSKLVLVNDKKKPTKAQIRALKEFADLGISTSSTEDWYCLLRMTQGDPDAILRCGYMLDGHNFLSDSLFCEWAYIVNLDTQCLEVYKGFQDKPHNKGRYAESTDNPDMSYRTGKYYSVALIADIPFEEVTSDKVSELEKEEEE